MMQPGSLDLLYAFLADDPALEQRLATIVEPMAFREALEAAARRFGVELDAATLAQTERGDPLGIATLAPVPPNARTWPGVGWLPGTLAMHGPTPMLDWYHFGGRPLDAPFFEGSLREARAAPFNRLFRRRMLLDDLVDAAPAGLRTPDGLIFHLSRCGSTLVAQMLAALPGAVVVSESAPFDSVLQLVQQLPDLPDETKLQLIRAVAGAYGRYLGSSGRFVMKLDSWHSIALPLLRRAFPETPWAFLYRDPVEIIVSQMRMRGMQMVHGLLPESVYNIPGGAQMAAEAYCAHVLARIIEPILAEPSPHHGLLVDYVELPEAVEARVLPHFGITPEAVDRAALVAASMRNAKAPGEGFTPDADEKQREASPAIRAAVEAHVMPRYEALRERRLAADR